MVSATTKGVTVSVKTEYQPAYSNPRLMNFVFSYIIVIENKSEYSVQLISRHWHIVDANGFKREVEGEGVIGKQPVIEPGEKYEYVSGCNLPTQLGKMYGKYIMERVFDGKRFEAKIPEFHMVSPYMLN